MLFAAFVFVQLVILRMGNQAGRGFLSEAVQEKVYLFLQVAAILGFLSGAFAQKLRQGRRQSVCIAALAVCMSGAGFMLFAPIHTLLYLVATGLTVIALGCVGGFVYARMAAMTASGVRVGLCTGIGYSCAVLLQYGMQLQWLLQPLLAAFLLAAFSVLGIFLLQNHSETVLPQPSPAAPHSAARFVLPIVITTALLLFTSFFNSYIHHLQIISNYTDYNAYSWPRLLMIGGVLLFGFLGDLRGGRYLPIGTLCVTAIALLNALLLGRETHQLNMCLYYLALSAIVSYYHITFLRLSAVAGHPALCACAGRILDSAVVILSFFVNFPNLPPAAVVVIDIAALAVIIIAMALNGDCNLSLHDRNAAPADGGKQAAEAVSEPLQPSEPIPPSDPFDVIRERYGLSPAELRVFRELVLTEDKQAVIGDRLSIKLRTVQANVTSIYRKTGLNTRSGLVQLYNSTLLGQ